ncbi:type VII secretion target [Nocardia canadensis]|uniref:type VII secretion target n=1 Tax=Nocardia canadensis TaxID=3065238 RepID=UPI00292ECEE7|nr:type VII secretion target [Nocardia canadensis]
MAELSVESTQLNGFRLDLQDIGSNFSANASRLMPEIRLPEGVAGLLAEVSPPLERFHVAVEAAQRTDQTAIQDLADNLSTAATSYQATDQNNAYALASVGGDSRSGDQLGTGDSVRYPSLQLPALTNTDSVTYSVRQTVTSAIESISCYDAAIMAAVGVQPAADLLKPLEADWESLKTAGKLVRLIGINDYVASQNLSGGATWLRSSWSGNAAQAFEASSSTTAMTLTNRSDDMEAVCQIVEAAATLLERLVHNQATELSGGLAKSITLLDFTFPLGVWAQALAEPIQESYRSTISSELDVLIAAARARQDQIRDAIGKVSQALEYTSGRVPPAFAPDDFTAPGWAIADMGTRRYGYSDNVWWENSLASTA